jgi:hypothetical protein
LPVEHVTADFLLLKAMHPRDRRNPKPLSVGGYEYLYERLIKPPDDKGNKMENFFHSIDYHKEFVKLHEDIYSYHRCYGDDRK